MKKIISICLLFVLILSLSTCSGSSIAKTVTCDEIVQAYEEAGCYISCHKHSEDSDSQYCHIIIYETEDAISDLVEINLYNTEDQAKDAAKKHKYNIAVWFIAAIYGESRWLISGSYGVIEYSSYNATMLKPLKGLMD